MINLFTTVTVVDLFDIHVFLVGSQLTFLILPFFDMAHLLLDIPLLLTFCPTPFFASRWIFIFNLIVDFLTLYVGVAYRLEVGTQLSLLVYRIHVHHTMCI